MTNKIERTPYTDSVLIQNKYINSIFRIVVCTLPFVIIICGRFGINVLEGFYLHEILPFIWTGILFVWIIINNWDVKKLWYLLLQPVAFYEWFLMKVLFNNFGG